MSETGERAEKGTITGRLMIKGGGPLSDGVVMFYDKSIEPPPNMTEYVRLPDEVFILDSEGRFTATLPEGVYYMGGLKRAIAEKHGPLMEGDLFLTSGEESGRLREYAVRGGERIDIGVIAEAKIYKKGLWERRVLTAVEGSVLDEKGRPVESLVVTAYTADAYKNGSLVGRPIYISEEKTSNGGKYLIRVADGGRYYLSVRDEEREIGNPEKGEPSKVLYGGSEPVSVYVKRGEILRGVDIKVKRFSDDGLSGSGSLRLRFNGGVSRRPPANELTPLSCVPHLESSEREAWQQADRVLDTFGIKEGGVVADIGAGSGFFTFRLSDRVGHDGKVYAVDIQQEMLDIIKDKMAKRGAENIVLVKSTNTDPNLPSACCERILVADCYNELTNPMEFMRNLKKALKPGGKIAIIEKREGADIPPPISVPMGEVIGVMNNIGYKLAGSFDFLEYQYFLVFQ